MVEPEKSEMAAIRRSPAVPQSDEAWDEKRDILEQLYLAEDRDLKEIIAIMKAGGFLAT